MNHRHWESCMLMFIGTLFPKKLMIRWILSNETHFRLQAVFVLVHWGYCNSPLSILTPTAENMWNLCPCPSMTRFPCFCVHILWWQITCICFFKLEHCWCIGDMILKFDILYTRNDYWGWVTKWTLAPLMTFLKALNAAWARLLKRTSVAPVQIG